MANDISVKVDDRRKTLRFGEALTCGSLYRITLDGCSVTNGSMQLIGHEDGEGEKLLCSGVVNGGVCLLSTNTKELAEYVKGMPTGSQVSLACVIHRDGDSEYENTAVGVCDVVVARVWSNELTGAAVMFKGDPGDKGNDGAGIADIVPAGDDVAGNAIYSVILTNGRKHNIIVPRGRDAMNSLGLMEHTDGTWHRVWLETNSDGERVVVVGEDAVGDRDVTLRDIDTNLSVFRNAANIAKLQLEETTCAVYVGEAKTAASAAKKQLEVTQKGAE